MDYSPGVTSPEVSHAPRVFIMQAAPCQVHQDGLATVLLGDDVVPLKRKRIEPPWNAAVVAPVESQPANLIEQSSIHSPTDSDLWFSFNERRAFEWRIPKVWPTRMKLLSSTSSSDVSLP